MADHRPTVTLHIGAMKTGTSFLQSVMQNNANLLAAQGLFWPGDVRSYQRLAILDLLSAAPNMPEQGGCWQELARRLHENDGQNAIISMEFLSFAPESVVANVVESLQGFRPRVVLGLRDLGRTIPAQWQESTQNGRSWPFGSYVTGLMAGDGTNKAANHFWKRQDWPAILRSWLPHVAREDVVVLTVPPEGSDRSTLWRRFAEATGIDSSGFDLDGRANDSLGAASAELMRRISLAAAEGGIDSDTLDQVRTVVGKRVLPARRSKELTLVVPPQHRAWVTQRSEEMIQELRALNFGVVGDLGELIPRWSSDEVGVTWTPMKSDADQLLAGAIDGLLAVAQALAVAAKDQSVESSSSRQ